MIVNKIVIWGVQAPGYLRGSRHNGGFRSGMVIW
jgi:hypothetical protein